MRHHRLDLNRAHGQAVEPQLTAGWQQTHDGAQQRALASAIGADHSHDLALGNRQAHLVNRLHSAVRDAEVADLQQVLAHVSDPWRSSTPTPR